MRLGLIILLLICITITGVYATWTYAGTDDIADAFAEAKITISDATFVGANGTYKIESNLVLTIDQKADGDHTAELVFSGNDGKDPYLTVTFTPSANAPQDIKNYGIDSELYFGTTTTMQFENKDGQTVNILSFSNVSNNVFEANIHNTNYEGDQPKWVKNEEVVDGKPVITFSYTLTAAELKSWITLNGTFVLDTKAEHDAFRAALTGNVVARVTDGKVNGTTNTENNGQ